LTLPFDIEGCVSWFNFQGQRPSSNRVFGVAYPCHPGKTRAQGYDDTLEFPKKRHGKRRYRDDEISMTSDHRVRSWGPK